MVIFKTEPVKTKNKPHTILSKNDYFPIIRGVRHEYDESGSLVYIWVAYGYGDYSRYDLRTGLTIDIRLMKKICKICHESKEQLDKGYCSSCKHQEQEFFTRLDCLFDKEDSQLNIQGSCLKNEPACGISDNAKYCHCPYILYLGRIGNLVKVGISRKSRRGRYFARLVEQGLNEAIVVDKFSSLPEVLEWERWFKQAGYCDRIYFADKIDALTQLYHIPLLELYPLPMWEELFPEKKIEHIQLYQHKYFSELLKGSKDNITGIIKHIQGPILITNISGNNYYWHLKRLVDYQVNVTKVTS